MMDKRWVLALAVLAAVPSSSVGQVLYHPKYPEWSPTKVKSSIITGCNIPPEYLGLEREYDGRARVMNSPSITQDQRTCAMKILHQWGIEPRR